MSVNDGLGNLNDGAYRSGVAARLAGIPVETLRVWERRYGVVGPRLSPRGQRLYSSVEIRRLALIKQLVDMGHPIGAIAALPTDALNEMNANARTLAGPSGLADDDTLREARANHAVTTLPDAQSLDRYARKPCRDTATVRAGAHISRTVLNAHFCLRVLKNTIICY